jgi:hypothetical protein
MHIVVMIIKQAGEQATEILSYTTGNILVSSFFIQIWPASGLPIAELINIINAIRHI